MQNVSISGVYFGFECKVLSGFGLCKMLSSVKSAAVLIGFECTVLYGSNLVVIMRW